MAKCEICAKEVCFGNNVSHSNRKTSRTYKPNVQSVKVNDNGTVKALISKNDFYALHSEEIVNDSFSGSLPAFVAAFSSRKKLSDEEIKQLQDMINKMRG